MPLLRLWWSRADTAEVRAAWEHLSEEHVAAPLTLR